jgi:hypothetical protein
MMLKMSPEISSLRPDSYLVSTYLTKAELKDELISAGSSSSFGFDLDVCSDKGGSLAF